MIDQAANLRTLAARARGEPAWNDEFSVKSGAAAPGGSAARLIAFTGAPAAAVSLAARKIAAAVTTLGNRRGRAVPLEDWCKTLRQATTREQPGDVLIVDASGGDQGRTDSHEHRALFARAHRLVVVTATDPISIVNSYVAVKTASWPKENSMHVIVHEAGDDELGARRTHRRIDESCRRFLDRSLLWLGETRTLGEHGESAHEHERIARLLVDPSAEHHAVAGAEESNIPAYAGQEL